MEVMMKEQLQSPILRRRDASIRMQCSECRKAIQLGDRYQQVDGQKMHLFCAQEAGKTATCPECFLIQCDGHS